MVLVIYTIVLSYNYIESRRQISNYAEMNSRNIAEVTASFLESLLEDSERAADDTVPVLLQRWHEKDFLVTLMEMVISQNQQIGGTVLYMNPIDATEGNIIHINRSPRGIKQVSINDDILKKDSTYYKMFSMVTKSGKSMWSQPMIEPLSGMPVVVFSMPVFDIKDSRKVLKGALMIEVDLNKIDDIISVVNVFNSGYCFVLSGNGTLISFPYKDRIAQSTIFDFARKFNSPEAAQIGRNMLKGESGFFNLEIDALNINSFIYYMPIHDYNWSLAIVCDQNDMFKGMDILSRYLIIIAFIGFIVLFILVAYTAGTITRPLRKLASAAYAIGKGNLNYEIQKTSSNDEVGVLTNVFSGMKESLKEHIEILTETTAAKEGIERELKIAHLVQMSILPSLNSIPELREFTLNATMTPAKEVGGDMYDFFMTDETSLWLIIGDVSGKGVPAAFYMALAKTMLHAAAISNQSPGEVLTIVNNENCKSNPYSMFITVFVAKLNIRTGIMHYSNAGHNPPVVIDPQTGLSFLDEKIGPACGIQPGIRYGTRKTRLSAGQSIFMFTDGVTESLNLQGELYTDERLQDLLSKSLDLNPFELIQKVAASINEFSMSSKQYDDITMLAVKYNGFEPQACHTRNAHISLENEIDNIVRVHGFIKDFSTSSGIKDSVSNDLQLVMEEIFINICRYAYKDDRTHYINISLKLEDNDLIWRVEDDGIPFNPLEHKLDGVNKSIEDMKIGGQGIRLVKKLTDSLNYSCLDGKNILAGKREGAR